MLLRWSRSIIQVVASFPSANVSAIFLWNISGSSEIPQEMSLVSNNISHLLISDVKICKHKKIGNTMFPKEEGSEYDTSWTEDNELSHIIKHSFLPSGCKMFICYMSPWLINWSTSFPQSLRSIMICGKGRPQLLHKYRYPSARAERVSQEVWCMFK